MTKPPKPLTPKQERFAQVVASGKSQAEAYRTAYDVKPETRDDSVWVSASQLASDPKVSLRINELKQELAAKVLWTKEQSVAVLAKIAQEEDTARDKIAAIKELNAMHGHNAPVTLKHEGEVGIRVLKDQDKSIFDRWVQEFKK